VKCATRISIALATLFCTSTPDDAQADEPGVRHDVGGHGGRVAGDVRFGIDVAFGEAAEEVGDAGQSGEGGRGRSPGRSK